MEENNMQFKEIFSSFAGRSSDHNDNSMSIMDYRDDIIFLWDNSTKSLLTQGSRVYSTKHQELRPTDPPGFDVTNIAVNDSCTRAALWGPGGVSVMDLPWRCGPNLEFQGGKKLIIVKCRHVGVVDLGPNEKILQVRWDPGSLKDSALYILSSDNTLYYTDCMEQGYFSVKIYRVGSRPYSRHKTLLALGETAVDFAFAPVPVDERHSNDLSTSLLILRGNGDVCLMGAGLSADDSLMCQVLPISPITDDSFLNEACSILVLPGKPPLVVIATSRGVLYHTLLVPLDIDQVAVPVCERRHRLLIIESVILDPGLQIVSDDLGTIPVRLIRDPTHLRRYLATHPIGVHSIVVEALVGVQKLLSGAGDADCSIMNASELQISPGSSRRMPESILEYLLCTSRPIQGCVIYPGTFLGLDSENNVIQLPMRSIEVQPIKLFETSFDSSDCETIFTQQMKTPFVEELEQLIQDSRVLPHMQFPPRDIPQEKLLELVVRISNLVRKETIPRYRQIRTILAQRVQLIKSMQQLQQQEISRLNDERFAITTAAESFGERIQAIVDELEDHKERVAKLIRRAAEMKAVPSDAERRMEQAIDEIESKIDGYNTSLDKLRKNGAYQDAKIVTETENQNMSIGSKQAAAIKSCLAVIGENIAQNVQKIKEINDVLGLSAAVDED